MFIRRLIAPNGLRVPCFISKDCRLEIYNLQQARRLIPEQVPRPPFPGVYSIGIKILDQRLSSKIECLHFLRRGDLIVKQRGIRKKFKEDDEGDIAGGIKGIFAIKTWDCSTG